MTSNTSAGTLFMLPSALDASAHWQSDTPASVRDRAHSLDYFLVENAKSARATLKRLEHPRPLRELEIVELPPEKDGALLREQLAPLLAGRSAGVISDAGCPGVADPGALAARTAHAMGIEVAPLVGPSSILLGLMASGLNGQSFAFHGYLPVDDVARARALAALEKASTQLRQTQLFIETPYRNLRMFEAIRAHCREDTLLCIASALTAPDQFVRTLAVSQWTADDVERIDRRPTLFLLLAA
ncbi:MAG: SAM-dependent methyltransferase [Gammaproteobacteria bacterium]|jgi:16S rRNA (cytidine1402-2'-O)-methyltransferase|nr:SAM-dependent methyltransferase [Gammaproteobacteria bacterium]MBU0773121.1 SAM-dependent methyltransferase [Gammaproteobacteria bacterium]MBU0855759.1 SAM-dependent methyltransferase [Gammaproteobacteria bacterium]MBU1846972.1 SAM-dependent methyltransferase [Gammaproteobacteria bacterium]